MAQALPPELMPPRPRRALPLPGRGGVVPSAVPAFTAAAVPSRVSCGGCGAALSVPPGPGRFSCPLCGAEIAPPPLAAVVAPPAAIPITSSGPAKTSEVLNGNSNQPILTGQVQKSIFSEHTHVQHHKHSFREESSSSFRVDSRTQTPDVGRHKCVNCSSDREESCMEPLNGTIARPGKKKSVSAAGPKSYPAGKLQEEHINKVIHASRAQGIPSNSEVLPDDMVTMHSKQKNGLMVAPSVIEHEQINPLHQVYNEQQAGDNSSDSIHAEQVQVACKAIQNNKKSTKYTKENQMTQSKSPLNYSTDLPHIRRSKRLAKGPAEPIDVEPIHRINASPNQSQSEAARFERTINGTDPISPNQHRYPQSVSNKLDNVDATTPALNHRMPQKEMIPQCYSQMYSPESRLALPNPSSMSWHEHEMTDEGFHGIVQLKCSDDEVHSIPLENQNQDMDGQLAEETSAGKNHLEQDSDNYAEHGRQKNGFIDSSDDAKHHGDFSSGMGTRHQINLPALLPVPADTPLPTNSAHSSFEKLPVNCSSPTTPHQQPSHLYSKDAWNGDILSASVSKSSKKRRGRGPAVLLEPRKEADRPVLTPNGTENWIVHPCCSKVTTTLSLLIKENYPGTYVSVDTNGTDKPCELVVYHWHQCPSDTRDTILDEFLKRYRWSPGQEEECQKIFDRKAVRQLVNLFCYEKQRARDLIAKKAKRSLAVVRGSRPLEEGSDGEDSEEQHGDESVLALDDPLNWKPFVPEWMQPKWWEKLCDYWAKDEVMKVSYQKRKNRNAGNPPCYASGSRSIAMHHRLKSVDNGRKLLLDIDPSTKINNDKGHIIDKKALLTEDTTYEHTAGARDAKLGPHPVQAQTGGCKRGRYYSDSGVRKKVQTDSLPKSSLGCSSNQEQLPMFTREQVQQMINQALQGLNETWEKKFLSLEQNMRIMFKSHFIPEGPKGSSVAVARDKQCQLARQDSLDSVDGEKHPAGGGEEDPESQDYEDEHWS